MRAVNFFRSFDNNVANLVVGTGIKEWPTLQYLGQITSTTSTMSRIDYSLESRVINPNEKSHLVI